MILRAACKLQISGSRAYLRQVFSRKPLHHQYPVSIYLVQKGCIGYVPTTAEHALGSYDQNVYHDEYLMIRLL
jgi:hypothetical protein